MTIDGISDDIVHDSKIDVNNGQSSSTFTQRNDSEYDVSVSASSTTNQQSDTVSESITIPGGGNKLIFKNQPNVTFDYTIDVTAQSDPDYDIVVDGTSQGSGDTSGTVDSDIHFQNNQAGDIDINYDITITTNATSSASTTVDSISQV